MMAAMMLPALVPTVALYSHLTRERSPAAPLLFATGYLVTWAGVGLLAFGIAVAGRPVGDDVLSWQRAGRWVAGATLLVAAAYELTPLKDACPRRCRNPIGFLLRSWRGGWAGALLMGAENGVMSITWMAFAAGLIAAEKTIPWRRVAACGTAAILLAR
jgi:predicted metal-binding membrane protein